MTSIKHHVINNPLIYSRMLLVLGFICALIATLTSGTGLEGVPWDYSYYHLISAAFTLYLAAFSLITFTGTPKWSRRWHNFTILVFLSAFSS